MLKLERIQYAALRIALGYRISTSTNIILGEYRLFILQHRAKYLCNRIIMKNLSNSGTTVQWTLCITGLTDSTTPLIGVIAQRTSLSNRRSGSWKRTIQTEKNYCPYLIEYNLLFSTISFETELGYLLKDAADRNSIFLAHLCNKPSNFISFFTDGSKDEVSATHQT